MLYQASSGYRSKFLVSPGCATLGTMTGWRGGGEEGMGEGVTEGGEGRQGKCLFHKGA